VTLYLYCREGEEVCEEKTHTVVLDRPEESCSLDPQAIHMAGQQRPVSVLGSLDKKWGEDDIFYSSFITFNIYYFFIIFILFSEL
jgi:hypothetical protein